MRSSHILPQLALFGLVRAFSSKNHPKVEARACIDDEALVYTHAFHDDYVRAVPYDGAVRRHDAPPYTRLY